MREFPSSPSVEDAPDEMFESGHLWLLEKIDGANFRFQLRDSGVIRFGGPDRVYDDPEAVPEPFAHAVRHVRERLDREALRRAVDDVESVVFFGEATHRHAIEYDWERLPSFLGFEVYSAETDTFRPPGAAQSIFERLGLEPVNAIERELHTRDFDLDSYAVPDSAWYDGPAAGVVVRNKRGGRAAIPHPDFEADATVEPFNKSAEEVAETLATDGRFETLEAELETLGKAVTAEALYDRIFEEIVREHHRRLYHGSSPVDMPEFRSTLAARTRAYLDGTSE